jgi:hypothetical protein
MSYSPLLDLAIITGFGLVLFVIAYTVDKIAANKPKPQATKLA